MRQRCLTPSEGQWQRGCAGRCGVGGWLLAESGSLPWERSCAAERRSFGGLSAVAALRRFPGSDAFDAWSPVAMFEGVPMEAECVKGV